MGRGLLSTKGRESGAAALDDELGACAAVNEFWDPVADAPGDEVAWVAVAARPGAFHRFVLATRLSRSSKQPTVITAIIPKEPTTTAVRDPEDFEAGGGWDRKGRGGPPA